MRADNVRAWLLFEAGRRADFDLSALTPDADFSHAMHVPDPSTHAWRRLAAHAKGGAAVASEFYAVASVASLLATSPDGQAIGLKQLPAWVPRAAAATRAP